MRQFILQKADQGLSCGRWGSLSSSCKHFVQLLTRLQGATVQASMFKPLLNKSLTLLSLKQFPDPFQSRLPLLQNLFLQTTSFINVTLLLFQIFWHNLLVSGMVAQKAVKPLISFPSPPEG